MKNLVMAMLFGTVLFGLSAGASWYLNGFANPPDMAEQDSEAAEPSVETKPVLPPDPSKVEKVDVMPVANLGQQVTIESVLQMSDAIKKMEGKLLAREKRVEKEEQRVALLFKDLSRERDELEAFSKGIGDKLAAMDQSMETLRETLDHLDTRKLELEKLEKQAGVDDQSSNEKLRQKVDSVKGWFRNLEPQQAADYIKEFANTGQIQFASSLIDKMEDRQKAKILASMDDPVLVKQLIDSLNIPEKMK